LKDKEVLRAYGMRQMALSDWTSGINHARREGMKEGIKTGEEQKAVEIARNSKPLAYRSNKLFRSPG
jgi:hypothetical protein